MEPSFFDKVYQVVALVPFGRVTTYGAIAEYLGNKGASRMVGWALNNSQHCPINLPAHRVVNRKGLLTGKKHFGGMHTMADLLMSEGISVINNQIQDFDQKCWFPGNN